MHLKIQLKLARQVQSLLLFFALVIPVVLLLTDHQPAVVRAGSNQCGGVPYSSCSSGWCCNQYVGQQVVGCDLAPSGGYCKITPGPANISCDANCNTTNEFGVGCQYTPEGDKNDSLKCKLGSRFNSVNCYPRWSNCEFENPAPYIEDKGPCRVNYPNIDKCKKDTTISCYGEDELCRITIDPPPTMGVCDWKTIHVDEGCAVIYETRSCCYESGGTYPSGVLGINFLAPNNRAYCSLLTANCCARACSASVSAPTSKVMPSAASNP